MLEGELREALVDAAERETVLVVEDREELRAITDQIMRAIAELSGQEYVDTYAADAKAESAGEENSGLRIEVH